MSRVVVHTERLGNFFMHEGDLMISYLAATGPYEPEVEEAVLEHVKPGMTVVDVGGNMGYFTRLLAEHLGEPADVWAIEPEPGNAELLRMNCPGVNVVEAAAWSASGSLWLYKHIANSGDHRTWECAAEGRMRVPAVALGSDRFPSFDFALVDAQASEPEVMQGFADRLPPKMLVEFWPHGYKQRGIYPGDVRRMYEALGYDSQVIGDTTQGHWNLLLTRIDEDDGATPRPRRRA